MKIKSLQFLFGLLAILQELIFLLDNSTIAYIGIVCTISLLYICVALQKNKLFHFIRGRSPLRFLYRVYILLVLISVFYFFEDNYFHWFIGLTPFVLTIPFLNITYSKSHQLNKININSVWAGIASGSLIVLLFVFIYGVSDDGRLSLGIISPSTIGRNGVIITLYAFSKLINKQKRHKSINFLLIVIGISSILLSSSKSSLVALILIFIFIILKFRLFSIKLVLILSITIIGLISTPYFDFFLENISMYQSNDYFKTLTGRTYIWENIILLINQKPWFGYGYNSPSLLLTNKYFDILQGRDIIQAHNALLQSMLNLGTIGTITLLLLIMSFIRKSRELFVIDKDIYVLLFPMFIFLLIRGSTEASFANGYSVDVFLFFIAVYQLILYNLSLIHNLNDKLQRN